MLLPFASLNYMPQQRMLSGYTQPKFIYFEAVSNLKKG